MSNDECRRQVISFPSTFGVHYSTFDITPQPCIGQYCILKEILQLTWVGFLWCFQQPGFELVQGLDQFLRKRKIRCGFEFKEHKAGL